MIVVMGAGGRLGGAVVSSLLERVEPDEVGVSTTRPEELQHLAERGVRVRRGDFDDADALRHAVEGAERLLLVSAPRVGDAAVEAHRTAIDAAREAGVSRVLYTSHVGADALSPFPPAVTHASTETILRDSGVAFTALRNGFYADTPIGLLRAAAETGELRVPADGPVSWTQHRDLGPGIAALLLDADLDETAVNLTAGSARTMAELAETASTVLDRPIAHTTVSDQQFAEQLRSGGAPDIAVTMSLGLFRASRQRRLGIVDPALATLIGRPTTPLEEALAA